MSIAIDYPAGPKTFPGGEITWRLSPDFPTIPVADLETSTFTFGWTKKSDCLDLQVPDRHAVDDFDDIDAACDTLEALIGAMSEWEGRVPAIRFVPTTSTSALLKVELDATTNHCSYNQHLWTGLTVYNAIGNQDPANNTLRVMKDGGCDEAGSMEHELGHALGLWHTQGRLDRDSWLTKHAAYIQWFGSQNMKPDASKFTDVGPFDFGSVMLYESYASNGTHTYTADAGSVALEDRSEPPDGIGDTLVFDASGVFNGVVYQDDAFPNRDDFFVDIEPKTTSGCFSGASNVPGTRPNDELEVAATIATLGLSGSDPNLLVASCYRMRRDGPNGTPGFEKEWLDVTVDHDAAYLNSGAISPVDVSAVMWQYYTLHDTASPPSTGDDFGQAVVVGDFDGDEVPDLAIAAPGFVFNATADAGSVVVFKGVYGKNDSGYVEHLPWMRLDVGGAVWSLAAGNFDGLSGDELAVGLDTPGGAGAVSVFSRLDRNGFLAHESTFTLQDFADGTWPATIAGAQFGFSLAVGKFGTRDWLVVGAPGAPAKNYDATLHDSSDPATQPTGWQASQATGVAVVLAGDLNDVLVPTTTVLDPFSNPYVKGSHAGARFGHAVAAHRSGDSLLVGSPEDFRVLDVDPGWLVEYETESGAAWPETRTGAVYAFNHQLEFRRRVWTAEVSGEFGAAVAMQSDDERYYVGAPNAYFTGQSDTIGAGRVYAYGAEMVPGTPTDESDTPTHDLSVNDFAGCGRWPGDRFGDVLTVGKLEPDAPTALAPELLAVGAPRRDLTCSGSTFTAGYGAVYVYDDVTAIQEVTNAAPHARIADDFGASIAFIEGSRYSFRVDDITSTASAYESGQHELVIGSPRAAPVSPFSGEVHVHGPDSTGSITPNRILDPDGP